MNDDDLHVLVRVPQGAPPGLIASRHPVYDDGIVVENAVRVWASESAIHGFFCELVGVDDGLPISVTMADLERLMLTIVKAVNEQDESLLPPRGQHFNEYVLDLMATALFIKKEVLPDADLRKSALFYITLHDNVRLELDDEFYQ